MTEASLPIDPSLIIKGRAAITYFKPVVSAKHVQLTWGKLFQIAHLKKIIHTWVYLQLILREILE